MHAYLPSSKGEMAVVLMTTVSAGAAMFIVAISTNILLIFPILITN